MQKGSTDMNLNEQEMNKLGYAGWDLKDGKAYRVGSAVALKYAGRYTVMVKGAVMAWRISDPFVAVGIVRALGTTSSKATES